MHNTISTIGAIIGAITFITVGAWYVSAQTPHAATIRYEQIQTDTAQTYPHQASAGRTWCVEQAD